MSRSSGDLTFELDLDSQTVQPGERVSGSITVGSDPKARGTRIELCHTNRCMAHTYIGLQIQAGTVAVERTFVDDVVEWDAGAGEHRFELTVPGDAPPSVAIEGGEPSELISWKVNATSDRKMARDLHAFEEVEVRSRSGQYGWWAERPAITGARACPVDVRLDDRLVHAGGKVSGSLVVTPTEDVDARSIRARLVRRRFDFSMRDPAMTPDRLRNDKTDPVMISVHKTVEDRKLADSTQLAAGEERSFPFELRLPKEASPSFVATYNELHWMIVGVVDRKRKGDCAGEAEIVAFTGERGGDAAQLPAAALPADVLHGKADATWRAELDILIAEGQGLARAIGKPRPASDDNTRDTVVEADSGMTYAPTFPNQDTTDTGSTISGGTARDCARGWADRVRKAVPEEHRDALADVEVMNRGKRADDYYREAVEESVRTLVGFRDEVAAGTR